MRKLLITLLVITILPVGVANARGLTARWTDSDISYQVQYNLDNDPTLKNQQGAVHISTVAFNKVLLLVGQVPTQEFKQHAEDIAKKVPEVKTVYNELVVGPPTLTATRSSDSWITTNIVSKFLFTKNLDSGKIKAITEDGVVYLLGKVSQPQGNLAAETASQISGVKKVVKIFTYTNNTN